MKLKLITREPADHLRHWAGYQAAIFDGVPTEPTERLIAVLHESRKQLQMHNEEYHFRTPQALLDQLDALIKELE